MARPRDPTSASPPLERLLENLHEWVLTISRDGVVLDVAGGRGAGGQSLALGAIGARVQELLPGNVAGEAFAAVCRALASGEVQTLAYSLERDGAARHREARVIPADGERVYVAIQDVTARREAEQALQRRDAILEAVSRAATDLLRPGCPDARYEQVLGGLGVAAEASRAYLFENHVADGTERWSQRFEWTAPGIEPIALDPVNQNVDWRAMGYVRWGETLAAGGLVHGNVAGFEPRERAVVEQQGVRSVVMVPVFVDGAWWGFLGFDECRRERDWSAPELDAFRAAAAIVGAAIERQRMERALLEREELFRRAFDDATIGMTQASPDSRILRANRAFAEMLGYTREELVGMTVDELTHPDDRAANRALVRGVRAGERDSYELRKRYLRKDGGVVWALLSATVTRGPDGSPLYTTAQSRDVSALVEAEEQLAALASRLATAQEEERERIAAEIHDDTLQAMTATQMRLQLLRRRLGEDGAAGLLDGVEESVAVTIERLRSLVFDLRPPELDQVGLREAIEAYAAHIFDETSTELELRGIPERIAPALDSIVYRVVREALLNVRKHARAQTVRVELGVAPTHVDCAVIDDGAGFDPASEATRPGHLGMARMRDIVGLVGGSLELASVPGQGAEVRFRLPRLGA